MENLIDWYKKEDKMSFVEKISLFHLKFESIHPFLDGNGRSGRLILNFELMKNNYVPINIKYKDRRRYYDAFKLYNEKTLFFLHLIRATSSPTFPSRERLRICSPAADAPRQRNTKGFNYLISARGRRVKTPSTDSQTKARTFAPVLPF